MQERLQKFMSSAGIASRRHAEEMIKQGLVKVNGVKVTELGTKVDPAKDVVTVRNKKVLAPTSFLYLAMNKPKRSVTTRDDPRKRKTVYDFLPPELRNVVWPIGRLDFATEGLLLFTNDGDLTQKLTHPSFEHEKEYEVKIDKELTQGRIEKIEGGMMIDGKKTSQAKIRTSGTTIYLTIHEGMNRQVRKMFGELNYSVRNLKRIRIGKLKLSDIPSGGYVNFDPSQII